MLHSALSGHAACHRFCCIQQHTPGRADHLPHTSLVYACTICFFPPDLHIPPNLPPPPVERVLRSTPASPLSLRRTRRSRTSDPPETASDARVSPRRTLPSLYHATNPHACSPAFPAHPGLQALPASKKTRPPPILTLLAILRTSAHGTYSPQPTSAACPAILSVATTCSKLIPPSIDTLATLILILPHLLAEQ